MENHLKTAGEPLEFKNKIASGSTLDIADNVADIFQDLKIRRKYRYIVIKIGEERIEIEKLGNRKEVAATLRVLIYLMQFLRTLMSSRNLFQIQSAGLVCMIMSSRLLMEGWLRRFGS